jgi:hypothetical protein
MAQAGSITRRSVAAGLALSAASGAVLATPDILCFVPIHRRQ